MPSLGELAGLSGVPSLSWGEARAALPPRWSQPKPQCFQLLGSPGDQTTARSSCPARSNICPGCCRGKTSEGGQDLWGQAWVVP